MSWQWIPAQLDVTPYDSGSSPNSTNMMNGWRPGYYVGINNDAGYYIVNGANIRTLSSNWIVTEYPFQRFSVSAYTSSDNLVSEFLMTFGDTNFGSTNVGTRSGTQKYYFGKPMFYGDGYVLKYSASMDHYIIMPITNKNVGSEPVYSVNVLSGGISGDHFWESTSLGELNLDIGYRYGPEEFTLAGAVDQYKKSSSTYIATMKLESKLDYYQYQQNEGDQKPAGVYTNQETGKTITVGVKTYKGNDDSVWCGYNLSNTTVGTRYSPYFQSSHGTLRYTLATDQWGDCWKTNAAAVYVYQTSDSAPSALPDSFTLGYYSWDSDLSTYTRDNAKDITLTKGPYQMLSSSSRILMGEVSQWR